MKTANILALCALVIFTLSFGGFIPSASWYAGLLLVVIAGFLKFKR